MMHRVLTYLARLMQLMLAVLLDLVPYQSMPVLMMLLLGKCHPRCSEGARRSEQAQDCATAQHNIISFSDRPACEMDDRSPRQNWGEQT